MLCARDQDDFLSNQGELIHFKCRVQNQEQYGDYMFSRKLLDVRAVDGVNGKSELIFEDDE